MVMPGAAERNSLNASRLLGYDGFPETLSSLF